MLVWNYLEFSHDALNCGPRIGASSQYMCVCVCVCEGGGGEWEHGIEDTSKLCTKSSLPHLLPPLFSFPSPLNSPSPLLSSQVLTPFQQVALAASSRKDMEEWISAFKVASSKSKQAVSHYGHGQQTWWVGSTVT